jgi:hypothetical protein
MRYPMHRVILNRCAASDRLLLIASLTVAAFLAICKAGEPAQAEAAWERRQRADAAVVAVSASLIDPALPDTPFFQWLQNTVGQDGEVKIGGYNSCEDGGWTAVPPSNPGIPWNVCTQVTAFLRDGRSVSIALAASVVPDMNRPGEWKPRAARLGSAYVIDGRPGPHHMDSLDVANLHELSDALAIPVSRWPHAELQVMDDLRLEPDSFKPGDRVTAIVTVRNVGAASARIRLLISGLPECSDIGFSLSPAVEGTIPPGQTVTLRSEITVPDLPRWWLRASTELLPVAQMIRKYEVTGVMKGTGKPIGPGPFKQCSV